MNEIAYTDHDIKSLTSALRKDRVILIANVTPTGADAIVREVADHFGLGENLAMQAAFASIAGHRARSGAYFMSVNERSPYQYVASHSEGDENIGMQLAALYCSENTTDGGVSIFQRTRMDGEGWKNLRAMRIKVSCSRKLTHGEISQARVVHQIHIPNDILQEDDEVLNERNSPIPGLKLFTVLSRVQPAFSRILGECVNVYWDNISRIDIDSGEEYLKLLRSMRLLREPRVPFNEHDLDYEYSKRIWRSGVSYAELFRETAAHKLGAGELTLHNNLTWTHSSSNWTPGSGTRTVTAAFA